MSAVSISITITDTFHALPVREQYDALGELIDQAKADVAEMRAHIAHDLAAEHGSAQAATILGISQQRVLQLRKRHAQALADVQITTVAYDFGDSIHVMDIDETGAWIEDTATVLPLHGDRDATLDTAGYTTVGEWTTRGEAEGITVHRP